MRRIFYAVCFTLCSSLFFFTGIAQESKADVATPDAIITALYDVISGPAGTRDWDRFRNLFAEGATINSIAVNAEGESYRAGSIHEYIDGTSQLFAQASFYEWEIGRKTHELGNLIQVFSAFECNLNDTMVQTGVNSIQLVEVNGRWYIAHLTFNTQDKAAVEQYFKN